jgi:hypothetical protein
MHNGKRTTHDWLICLVLLDLSEHKTLQTSTNKGDETMSKLTVGDCVIILGKPWARGNNIRTAEDLLNPAPEDWAQLARQTHAVRESIAEAKEVLKEA